MDAVSNDLFHDLDLYSDASLTDPFPIYDKLRKAGEAVWLPQHGVWAVAGYETAKTVLRDHRTFVSGQGIGLTPAANEATRGSVLASDPPTHSVLRSVLNERLSPRSLLDLKPAMEEAANQLVDTVIARETFDAVADFAKVFPLSVVVDLIGVSDDVRPKLLRWADSMFNTFGPPNARTFASLPDLEEMGQFLASVTIDQLSSGSLGAAVYEAGERGTLHPGQCAALLGAYLGAGLDTTINAIAAALKLFSEYPEQWDLLRSDRSLIPQAFDEVLRLESPALGFSRVAAVETELGGQPIAKGDRVLVLFAAANRDPRKYVNPDRFDILRDPTDHVAFGSGRHHCAGQGLARLEAEALLQALADKVLRFEAGEPILHLNNVIRGLGALPMRIVPLAR